MVKRLSTLIRGPGARRRQGRHFLLFAICLAVAALAAPARAITIISQSANTTIALGQPHSAVEFENPLTGTETVLGYRMIEWRDADYSAGPPHWYDDWSVSNAAAIDGNINEIWMRGAGQSIWTTTTVPSTVVSIHMIGDQNDGLAQVTVDGNEVARMDMGTSPVLDRVIVLVKGLPNGVHRVQVNDLGWGPSQLGTDVATFGAAALQESDIKWDQPPAPAHLPNVFNGWNEMSVFGSPQICADDFVCSTGDPITDIHWWGSFLGWKSQKPPLMPGAFHFAIWTDVPASQEPLGFSHPGKVIWEADCTSFNWEFAGWDYDPRTGNMEACFRFDQDLQPGQYFPQPPGGGGVYWLSISAVYPDGTVPENPWGWKTRPRDRESFAPDDAVVISAPTSPHINSLYQGGAPLAFPTPADSWDMAFELTSFVQGLKWQQNPDPTLPGLHAHDGPPLMWTTLADDWQCEGGMVSDLHWWGNYEVDDKGIEKRGSGINHFHLSIHPDVPAPPFSHPGQEFFGADMMLTPTMEVDTGLVNVEGSKIYEYTYLLPEPMYQGPGSIYWFDITAYSNDAANPAMWRWQESARTPQPRLDAAVSSDSGAAWKPIVWSGDPPRFSELAFAVTSGSVEPMVKWSQPPVTIDPPNVFNGWNEPSVYGSGQIVGDDWLCLTEKPVTDIHWWGSYIGWSEQTPPELQPSGFHIAIWTDVAAEPIPGSFSHPGQVIWQTVCENFKWKFVGWDLSPREADGAVPEACFLFEQDLPSSEWFWQKPQPGIYWISIAAMYPNGTPGSYSWGWKTRPKTETMPPDDAVRIFDPAAPVLWSIYKQGAPIWWPQEVNSWDVAFRLTTTHFVQPGKLIFNPNITIRDHFYWKSPTNAPNEMLSATVSADANEAVQWTSVTLQAAGTGNDKTDISSVDVYMDNNNDGVVNAGDTLVGSGAYGADDGQATISIGPAPVVIPASGSLNVLIAYVMSASALSTPSVSYQFDVVGAAGTGQGSGVSVSVTGLPLSSARKVIGRPPMRIGEAKRAPVGTPVLLDDKVITADFQWTYGIFYIEEEDRSAGIGVTMELPSDSTPLAVGNRVSVLGTTAYRQPENTELIVLPQQVIVTPDEVMLRSLRTNNRGTGGGVFGQQPAVVDDAFASPRKFSRGLNNVGSLITTWGRVTYRQPSALGMMIWINDGSDLRDGTVRPVGGPVLGVAVLLPPDTLEPDEGMYVRITGILWAIPSGTPPDVYPARLLVPRDSRDIEIVEGPAS